MGICVIQWRARIGLFSQPVKYRVHLQTLVVTVKYMSFSIRLVLFLLLVVEGIESNPGPPPISQSTVSAIGCGRWAGRGASVSAVGVRTRSTTRSQGDLADQPTLNAWLNSSQAQPLTDRAGTMHSTVPFANMTGPDNSNSESDNVGNNDDGNDVDSQAPEDDLLLSAGVIQRSDLKTILLEVRHDVKSMNRKFDKIEKTVNTLKKDNQKLKRQNEKLTNKVDEISKSLEQVDVLARDNQRKNEKLKAQSRRDNLNFYNIEDDRNETWEQSEEKVVNQLSDELNIDGCHIERAHRLPSKSTPRPIIAKFSFFKDKDKILKKYREKQKIARQNMRDQAENATAEPEQPEVRVSEDFPERVTKMRSLLYPFLKQSLDVGKNTYLKFDKLVVDNTCNIYDENLKQPVPVVK